MVDNHHGFIMRFLTWAIRLLLFFVTLLFALKNSDPVNLQFFFGQAWRIPLVLLLLGFFAVGILFGILAVAEVLFKERRISAALRRDLERISSTHPSESKTEY